MLLLTELLPAVVIEETILVRLKRGVRRQNLLNSIKLLDIINLS